MLIKPGSKYGDPRAQASLLDGGAHGLTGSQVEEMRERFETMMPQLVSKYGNVRSKFDDVLPPGASWSKQAQALGFGTGSSSIGTGATMFTQQTPYQPEFCGEHGTPIVLEDGSNKAIQDVIVGDKVLDKDGRVQIVEAVWCDGIPGEIVKIKLHGGIKLGFTTNHRFPVWAWPRKCLCGCGQDVSPGKCYAEGDANGGFSHYNRNPVKLIKIDGGARPYRQRRIPADYNPMQECVATDIRKGDFLLMPRKFDAIKTDVTDDMARLLGYYIAEGCVGEYGLQFSLGAHEESTLAKDIADIIKANFDVNMCINIRPNVNCCIVSTSIKKLAQLYCWLAANGGKYALHKKLSGDVMRWPVRLKIELLKGMFYGDGSQFWTQCDSPSKTSIDKNKLYTSNKFSVTYTTISRTLAHQTQLILAQIGVFARITKVKECERRFVRQDGSVHISPCKKVYRLVLYGSHAAKLADLLWGKNSRSNERQIKNQSEKYRVDDNYVYVPVKSVEIVKNDKPVYNLTVSGSHSYLADGFATFNSSPDRQQYPVHRILANRYWRMFYKLDPVLGTAVDMFSELPWSEFELTGEGIEGDIRNGYQQMCSDTQLLALLPYFVKEFMIVGEACPHCLFDTSSGMWSHIALHNPDQLEVIDAPFIKMDPIVEFIPDDRLRAVLTSSIPALQAIRNKLPTELLSRLQSRQNIPLSPLNFTFLPRKLHPYDTRGTSIVARLWRVFMYEDGVFNASIQTARRASSPLKIAKLGNPATGYIPTPDQERRLLELLAQAEMDPQCFTPDMPANMADGTMKLVGELRLGDKLVDKNNKECEVLAWQEENASELISITLAGEKTLPIKCTPTHKWPVYRMRDVRPRVEGKRLRITKKEYYKLPASEIKVGDYLAIPRTFEEVKTKATPEMARLLGYYLAEGCSSVIRTRSDGSQCIGSQFTFGPHERDTLVADVTQIIKSVVGVEPNIYHDSRMCSVRLLTNGTDDLSRWLKKHANSGSHASSKCLSTEVMSWPLGLKKELIRGYLSGDGCRVRRMKNGEWTGVYYIECSTASVNLAYQLQILFAQLGTYTPIRIKQNPKNSLKPDGHQYRLMMLGDMADELVQYIWGNTVERKTNKKAAKHTWDVDDNFVYVKITDVQRINYNGKVINLTVSSPDHSYRVCGVGTYNSWLVYNYAVQFELAGAPERVMSIVREWDAIERIKLVALGVNKSFLFGETTYSSAATGLQIFLSRLKALRLFFEHKWLYPKFFKPIAEINGWIKPKPSEVVHRFRVKRSASELEAANAYIIPKLRWEKSLDPQINTELIQAMNALEQLGVKFSKTTKMATVGFSFEEETKKIQNEMAFERKFLPAQQTQEKKPGGAPMLGGGGPPPMPPSEETPGIPPLGEEKGPAAPGFGETGMPPGVTPNPPPIRPPEASKKAAVKEIQELDVRSPAKSSDNRLKSEIWINDIHGNWEAKEVGDLIDLLNEQDTDSPLWSMMKYDKSFKSEMESGDPNTMWECIDTFLQGEGYPDQDIKQLRGILEAEGVLKKAGMDELDKVKFASLVSQVIDKNGGNGKLDSFFVGAEVVKDK